MSLVLIINGLQRLDNGGSPQFTLNRHGGVIGRSPVVDWTLPDPHNFISSTHCEIDFRDGAYTLVDRSKNGTFVNRAQAQMTGPHRICDGDVIQIGHYEITARLDDGAAAAAPLAAPAQAVQWGGWDAHATPVTPRPPSAAADWDRPAPQPAISGRGPMSQNWAAPRVDAPPAPAPSAWDAPAAPSTPASGWSSPVGETPAVPNAVDVWGQLAAGNAVDWQRGGFGAPAPPALAPQVPASDPFGLSRAQTHHGQAVAPTPAPAFPSQTAPSPPSPTPPAPAPQTFGGADGDISALLAAAGVSAADLKAAPGDALAAAGLVLSRLVAGMIVMLEARARAKAQLGAQGTTLEFDGNNPLKFARSPGKAVAQLLNPPERGFMAADRAIEDAFRDLQAHQMATLTAMQGALAATLARFSPEAIRGRAETRGLLAKIIPSAREAALWQAYEREFEGVARGSDEAFMDIFAKEFRDAYQAAIAETKTKP
jgi:type VI secretion system protein